MSPAAFLRCATLSELGIDHGLGTRASCGVEIPELACAKQVHGSRMIRVPPSGPSHRADALWTRTAGAAVGVQTADCVPILLVDGEGQGVAAIHAGWRGSAARIASLAVSRFALAISAPPDRLIAVIGPHIGPCCYEVDDPVHLAINVPEVFAASPRLGRYQLDLYALNRLQLIQSGVRAERILRVGGCTCCDAETYASYRRDGTAGRMLHYVRMPLP